MQGAGRHDPERGAGDEVPPSGDLSLSTRRIRAVATATAAICQRDWTRHHPSRADPWMSQPGCDRVHDSPPRSRSSRSISVADLRQLLGRAGLAERLHHQLDGRAAEGPLQQVADQLLLGLLLGPAGPVDVRTAATRRGPTRPFSAMIWSSFSAVV